MRLTDLEARFVNDQNEGLMLVLLCPKCKEHKVRIPVIVTAKQGGEGGRWSITSLDLASLTVTPSVQASSPQVEQKAGEPPPNQPCPFHFSIANGEIVFS
jgi:Family of unknown function (DUF6527)